MTKFCFHPRCHHDPFTAAISDKGPVICRIFPVTERHVSFMQQPLYAFPQVSDSPVRAASSTFNRAASISLISAGTTLPASRRTMSPGTRSEAGIVRRCAVSYNYGGWRRHLLKGCHSLFSPVFLDKSYDRIEDNDYHYGYGIGQYPR